MKQGLRKLVYRRKEEKKFIFYFVLTFMLAIFVADMMARGWLAGHLSNVIFWGLPNAYLGVTLEQVAISIFGLYLGFLILLNLDIKKSWQGRILLIATFIALITLGDQNVFWGNVDLISNFPILFGGLIFGLIIGGKRRLSKLGTSQPLEFREVVKYLYFIFAVLTIGAFLEYHILYPAIFDVNASSVTFINFWENNADFGLQTDFIYRDLAVSGVFLISLKKFFKYDAENSFFVLGPKQSGKTLFIIGAYLEALQSSNEETPMNPTKDLINLVDDINSYDNQYSDGWNIQPTGREENTAQTLGFQFVHGRLFPLNISLQTIDYPGEYLKQIPDAIKGTSELITKDRYFQKIFFNVDSANTLIFLIDIERYFNKDKLNISDYFEILESYRDKDVMLVATKCDYFAEKFTQENGIDPLEYYEDFVEYVNDILKNNSQIYSLIKQTGGKEIHPVYYQTRIDENGIRVPLKDSNNSVILVGFDKFLNKLS
ncbi:conserved hypothetical protein (plasmid) [Methanohalobium evestigatum Z-7303]|uniref:Uncharacterized protein n=1 Tax=Methanohalobium evestigatum (strain ATCC BAA-1072 / DSM 3721 / NBRC 107634 / OCM 161 / Z-7303) TaxID=644295 RepID=D7EBZ7_METEZ|nr:hypothetical protein [Methanohalobium evestigatum]ADI75119.1 conserved hypothetical protein [Methanohalobium evestigatum Z-7303]